LNLEAHLSVQRIGRFIRQNLRYGLLLPVVIVLGTLIHEAAHAAAILLQGGRVTRFEILPQPLFSLGSFGRTAYTGIGEDGRWFIALAPALLGIGVALCTAAVSTQLRRGGRLLQVLVAFGFLGPLVDASIGAAGLFGQVPRSDWFVALHGLELPMAVAFGAYISIFGEIGLFLFRRAWGDALSTTEYTLALLLLIAMPWGILLV
jgi:hypothetical protein